MKPFFNGTLFASLVIFSILNNFSSLYAHAQDAPATPSVPQAPQEAAPAVVSETTSSSSTTVVIGVGVPPRTVIVQSAPAPVQVIVGPGSSEKANVIDTTSGGIGFHIGRTDGDLEWAVDLLGHNQSQSSNGIIPGSSFLQGGGFSRRFGENFFRGVWAPAEYSTSQFRLELGTGVGIDYRERTGETLIGGLASGDGAWSHIAPYVAVHPFDLNFDANTNHHREPNFEWNILGAAGLQYRAGKCMGVIGALGGGSLGTLGSGGARWAEGGTTSLTCPSVMLSADALRLNTPGRDVDLPSATLSVPVGPFQLNLRGEAIITDNGNKVPLSQEFAAIQNPAGPNPGIQKLETRAFFIFGGRLPGEPTGSETH